MENQVNKSFLKSLGTFFRRFKEFISIKRRKHKVYQLETKRIMDRIVEIKNRHPELLKYLNKIPEFQTNSNDSEIRLADLRRYHTKLLDLLEKYELELKKRFWFI